MDNAEAIVNLINDLNAFKKSNPFNPTYDEPGRHTFCHILFFPNEEQSKRLGVMPHKFEVRGFSIDTLACAVKISAVNWTVGAGTCSLMVDEHNIHQFKILEKEPSLQVLYG